jgi:hypothetical protein
MATTRASCAGLCGSACAPRARGCARSPAHLFVCLGSHRAHFQSRNLWLSFARGRECVLAPTVCAAGCATLACCDRPEFVDGDEPVLELVNARHPCLTSTFRGDFIPNSISVGSGAVSATGGGAAASCVLLTGPNVRSRAGRSATPLCPCCVCSRRLSAVSAVATILLLLLELLAAPRSLVPCLLPAMFWCVGLTQMGGKSTLLRQTCLAVLIAQMVRVSACIL